MALDPTTDQDLEAQLYGDTPASLADALPAPQGDPWSWVPSHWNTPEADQLAQAIPAPAGPLGGSPPPLAPPLPVDPGPPVDPLAGTLFGAGSAMPVPAPDPLAGTIFGAGSPPLPAPSLPAPLPPPVDAITGAGEPASSPAPAAPTAPAVDPDNQAYLNWLAKNDPERFAEVQFRFEDAKQKHFEAERAKVVAADHATQMANLRRRELADEKTRGQIEALHADAERIAATKIDPSGGVHGVRRVAGVINSILGGLIQARKGGRNAGLDALNEAINQGIEAQKADLVNQREGIGHRNSTLGQELARHNDVFQAEEATRQAALKQADDQLATEQQNFDPRGTNALRIAAIRAGIAQQRAASVNAYQQKTFENNLKLAELADKEAARRAAAQQAAKDQSLGWARLGLEGQKFSYDQKKDAQDFDLRRQELASKRDEKRLETERELSLGTPVPRLKVDDKGAPVVDESGRPVTEAGELRQKDGSLFLAPDKETRAELAKKTLAASEVSDIINRILDIRDRVGGESDTFNSDEAQQLKTLQDRLVILAKSGTQGMSSDEDMKRIAGAAGASNVSSFRSQAAGLKEGLQRTSAELNKAYRIAKYSGPKIEFANPYSRGPENTAAEDVEQSLLQKPEQSLGEAVKREIRRRTLDLSPDQLRAYGDQRTVDALVTAPSREVPTLVEQLSPLQRAAYDDVVKTYSADASYEQQQRIAELGQAARTDDKARQLLLKVSTDAHTSALRNLAKKELSLIQTAEALGRTEELPIEFQGTAREAPPPPRAPGAR